MSRRIPEKAQRWLETHGFDTETVRELHATTDHHPSIVEIAGVFICQRTGLVHFCDERCQEQLLTSGQKACPISGRTVPTVLLSQEERSQEEGEEEDHDYCGRLGRAFAAGYGCSDETELWKMWR